MSRFSDLVKGALNPAVLSTFGESVTYYPKVGDPYEIVLAPNSGTELQQTEKVYQTGRAPLASFLHGEPCKGDVVVIDGTTYEVSSIEKLHPDGRRLGLSVTYPR